MFPRKLNCLSWKLLHDLQNFMMKYFFNNSVLFLAKKIKIKVFFVWSQFWVRVALTFHIIRVVIPFFNYIEETILWRRLKIKIKKKIVCSSDNESFKIFSFLVHQKNSRLNLINVNVTCHKCVEKLKRQIIHLVYSSRLHIAGYILYTVVN